MERKDYGLPAVALLLLLLWNTESSGTAKYEGAYVLCQAPYSAGQTYSDNGLGDFNNCYGVAQPSPGESVEAMASRFRVTVNPAANVVSLRFYHPDKTYLDIYPDNCKVADSKDFDCITKSSNTNAGDRITETSEYMMTDGHYAYTDTIYDPGSSPSFSYTSGAAISGIPYTLWNWGIIDLPHALALSKFKLSPVL